MLLGGALVGRDPGCGHRIGLRVLAQMLLQADEGRLSTIRTEQDASYVRCGLAEVCIHLDLSMAVACQNRAV